MNLLSYTVRIVWTWALLVDNQDAMAFLHRITRFVLVASASGFLVASSYANSAVLCIGTGGHVQIELSSESCCRPDQASRTPRPPSAHADSPTDGSEKCGDCSDISLSGEYCTPTKQRIALEMNGVAVNHGLALAQLCPGYATGILPVQFHHLPDEELASLRSVILLT
mgnify:CR=1 FL=1